MTMINSIVSNVGAGAYDGDRYAQKAKAMFDDDGSANTGIEVVRLNKKFDIFLKRFARAEEDIKEVKQNFYRVMHCAFAKYEQGFKRKNEYLEKRKSKRHDEIQRGVEMELEKRGLTGKIDDPLLNSHAQSKPNDKNEGMAGEDSLMLGGMCYDEES